ncbi:hypothetical protein H1P_220025 [Hyella patelloides LEGE 07179]|uniref:Uncharacterized protein n=1 Tax=Hyella patelloides LEGE 07179 TaxID=945734 RepID=A0A563VQW0_9CYAN|nr:hypothetical protein H1P_220025 [Hyella patelloides LEGE 07179]
MRFLKEEYREAFGKFANVRGLQGKFKSDACTQNDGHKPPNAMG